jgi:hypothetical protein
VPLVSSTAMNAFRRELRRRVSQAFRPWRSVLLQGGSPMNVVVLRPLIDAMGRDPRIRLFLSGKFRQQDDPQGLIDATGLAGVTPLSKREARKLRADLYVSAEGSRPAGKRSHRRALVFHGASFKGRSVARKTRFFDRILLVGPWQRRQFVARGWFSENDPRLVAAGMPKLDRLVRGDVDRDAVRRGLGIGHGEKLVLYAPTWGEHSSIFTMGDELVRCAAAIPGVRIVVKLHDHLLDPTRSEIDWRSRLRAFEALGVVRYDDVDVVPALAAADVLVSDASSVLQEFALLDRPIVYADVPELFASSRYRKSADTATWHQKGGIVIRRGEEIVAALERSFAAPSEFSAQRRAIAQDVFYCPGDATRRCLEILYAELALDAPPLAAPPIRESPPLETLRTA